MAQRGEGMLANTRQQNPGSHAPHPHTKQRYAADDKPRMCQGTQTH